MKQSKTKKDRYHIHDIGYKDLYSKKEVAIDLFKSLENNKWTKDIKAEDLTLVNKSFVTCDYDETEADIVYRANVNNKDIIFYILLEFQSTIDYRMPIRLLFYICEILRDYSKNEKHTKYDKNLKVPAVVPIVLYNGKKPWDVEKEFRKITFNEDLFGDNIINFNYDVFDINNDFTKEELIKNKNVTSAIFLLDQKIDAFEFLQRIKAVALFFNGLTQAETKAIKNWIKNTAPKEIAEPAIEILEAKKEDIDKMVASNAYILDELKEAGKEEAKKDIARNLLDILDDETIALKTGLKIKDIELLREGKAEYNTKK
ncbi:MAG: Rpn family recombination-promoting nuclease/putative transposase [Clostridium sp.]